jgi:hypothetical protein
MECGLAALPAGLTGSERLDALAVLSLHTRNLAALASSREREAELNAAIGAVLAEHAERFPAVAAAIADAGDPSGHDQAFDFGVARILDGLEVLIRSRSTPSAGPRD